MANGKALQQFKDKLDDKGCKYGQFTDEHTNQNKADINAIGKKLSRIYAIAISVLIALLTNALIMLFKR